MVKGTGTHSTPNPAEQGYVARHVYWRIEAIRNIVKKIENRAIQAIARHETAAFDDFESVIDPIQLILCNISHLLDVSRRPVNDEDRYELVHPVVDRTNPRDPVSHLDIFDPTDFKAGLNTIIDNYLGNSPRVVCGSDYECPECWKCKVFYCDPCGD